MRRGGQGQAADSSGSQTDSEAREKKKIPSEQNENSERDEEHIMGSSSGVEHIFYCCCV